jgi:hypothetical protein
MPSRSSTPGRPQAGDIRIQPNPSLDTSGPFLPKAIFVIVDITLFFFDLQHKDQRLEAMPVFLHGSIYLSGRLTIVQRACA